MSLNCYFANFTSYMIVTALADANGNVGQITRGSDFVQDSTVAAGFQIPPNTISPALAAVNTQWDWMYFNLLNPDNSVKLQLQAYLKCDGSPTTIEVGLYDPSTSNDNPMPSGVYRNYGGGNGNGIWFILADEDLP